MKILISGGSGFIGSNLALQLVELGNSIVVLDNLSPQVHGDNPIETSPLYKSIIGKVDFVLGSVTDRSAWENALRDCEAVIHLAAETGTGQSMYQVSRYVDVNVGGTALLLDVLANCSHSVRRVVVASSRSVYGEGKYISEVAGIVYPGERDEHQLILGQFDPVCPSSGKPMKALPTDESSKIHPSSIYGITKSTQEQLVLTACRAMNIPATALRYQNVYGPGQSLQNPYTGILSIFSTRILNGNPIDIFEDGLESRDFVYIDDVVSATVAAVLRSEESTEAIGIGSGVATSVIEVANALVKCLGIEVPIRVTGAFRKGDIRHNFADLTLACNVLKFDPKFDFLTGVAKFVSWVNQQEVQNDGYEKSISEMKSRGMIK